MSHSVTEMITIITAVITAPDRLLSLKTKNPEELSTGVISQYWANQLPFSNPFSLRLSYTNAGSVFSDSPKIPCHEIYHHNLNYLIHQNTTDFSTYFLI